MYHVIQVDEEQIIVGMNDTFLHEMMYKCRSGNVIHVEQIAKVDLPEDKKIYLFKTYNQEEMNEAYYVVNHLKLSENLKVSKTHYVNQLEADNDFDALTEFAGKAFEASLQ